MVATVPSWNSVCRWWVVETDLVAVGVVKQGQDPADAGPVHSGVLLAQPGQPGGQVIDRRLVGHADAEIVETRRGPGALGIEAQGERRTAVGVRHRAAHQLAFLDEFGLEVIAQPTAIPLQ